MTLGDRRDAQEPCRAILGRVPVPAPFPCPFWLADTAGWKNSVGMGRSGLEASGEKGFGGAAGEREEGAGEQARAGRPLEGGLAGRGLPNKLTDETWANFCLSLGVPTVKAREA